MVHFVFGIKLSIRPSFRLIKVKVKLCTLDIAPVRESPPQKRSGMARVLKGSDSSTCSTHTFMRNWNEPNLPSGLIVGLILITV